MKEYCEDNECKTDLFYSQRSLFSQILCLTSD